MIKFSSQSLPSIDFRKGESIIIYPSKNESTLEDLRVAGVSTFWRSPYKNEVYSGVANNSHSISTHRLTNPKPLGEVKGILKNKSFSKDSESDSSGDEIKKLRGILTKKMAEGALRKKSGKRVQFDDRLVRLHEISRRHGYTSSGESVTSDEIDDPPHSARQTAVKDSKQKGSCQDRIVLRVPKIQRQEEISSDARPARFSRCSSAPTSNSEKNTSKSLDSLENWVKSSDNKYLHAECKLTQDSFMAAEAEKQPNVDTRPPRLTRSFTSPVLLSQRSPKKPVLCFQSSSRHESTTTSSSDTPTKKHLVISARSYPQSRVLSQAAAAQHFEVHEIQQRNSNFCNNDKTNQIIRWLKDVNLTQAREGRCTVLLPGMSEHKDM